MLEEFKGSHCGETVLPGFGFFGNDKNFSLICDVDQYIDRLVIYLESDGPGILNIGNCILYDKIGREYDKKRYLEKVSVLPAHKDDTGHLNVKKFLSGKLIRSSRALNPTLEISFKSPIEVSKIEIFNTQGVFAARSRDVVVKAYCLNERVFHYKNMCNERMQDELAYIMEIIKRNGSSHVICEGDFRKRLVDLIRGGELNWGPRRLVQLLPMFEKSPILGGVHIAACARIIRELKGEKPAFQTRNLRIFSKILSTDYRLQALEAEMNISGQGTGDTTCSWVISKHLVYETKLKSDPLKYAEAIYKLTAVLDKLNVHPMLCYGTLLGAVRDADFVAHDDDVDLLYYDGSASEEEALKNKRRLINLLADQGIESEERPRWNFHPKVGGVTLDLFPSWRKGDSLYLMMENGKIRSVPVDIVLPRSAVEFYGYRFPAPANPEAFLSERYGENWRCSDPYHEWHWPLTRIMSPLPSLRTAMGLREQAERKQLGRTCLVAWAQRVGRTKDQPPKNSLPMVRRALRAGFDAVELDVRLSRDGTPVLSHDDRLRGPDGEIVVSKSSSEELARFRLGVHEGEDVFVPTLQSALHEIGDMDVQIDPRIGAEDLIFLREAIDAAGFDRRRMQFCVYDFECAEALVALFPESVLLWKTYKEQGAITEQLLDELVKMGLDGIMVKMSRPGTSYDDFVARLKARRLRGLFFVLGGQASRFRRVPIRSLPAWLIWAWTT